jgi:cytochrome c biogenesis protein CcdA
MNIALILALISIGLVDSINPSAIVMTIAQLSGRTHVVRNSLAYIVGIFCTYYTLGVVLILAYAKFGSLVSLDVTPITTFFYNPPQWAFTLQGIIGLFTIIYSVFFFKKIENEFKESKTASAKSSILSSFILGIVITGVEAGTAIPYFGAILTLYLSNIGIAQSLILLVMYNLIFVLPPLCIIGLYLIFKDQFQSIINIINQLQVRYTHLVIKYGMIGIGMGLIAGSIIK